MQLTQQQSEIAEAFKLLTETYPNERIDFLIAYKSPTHYPLEVQFSAWIVSEDSVWAYGPNFLEAARNLIAKAGPRDPQAALKSKIAKAQEAMDAARGELLKLQTEQKMSDAAPPTVEEIQEIYRQYK